ncbi:hypothetical protein [Anaerovorax odorimutans]|uniref:hypothetical protein n=1 Tax=Anaerovorax odorimutans TaxID=109327 RepID=UPI00048A09C9|nr:hypothetical protein [Anaerovorax odorimutans]
MIKKSNFTRINIAKIIYFLSKIAIIIYLGYGYIFFGFKWMTLPWWFGIASIFIPLSLVNIIDRGFNERQIDYLSGRWKALPLISELCAFLILALFLILYVNNSIPKLILVPLQIIVGLYFLFSDVIIKKLHSYFYKFKSYE